MQVYPHKMVTMCMLARVTITFTMLRFHVSFCYCSGNSQKNLRTTVMWRHLRSQRLTECHGKLCLDAS